MEVGEKDFYDKLSEKLYYEVGDEAQESFAGSF